MTLHQVIAAVPPASCRDYQLQHSELQFGLQSGKSVRTVCVVALKKAGHERKTLTDFSVQMKATNEHQQDLKFAPDA